MEMEQEEEQKVPNRDSRDLQMDAIRNKQNHLRADDTIKRSGL